MALSLLQTPQLQRESVIFFTQFFHIDFCVGCSVVRVAGRHERIVLSLLHIGTEVWSSSEDGSLCFVLRRNFRSSNHKIGTLFCYNAAVGTKLSSST
jgi:hypothetical protein